MNYKIKPTKKQLKILRKYWKLYREAETNFQAETAKLEVRAEKETGIKGLEFFCCDGGGGGIGNYARTMKLIQRGELDD